jgi:hypothetical protein
VRFAVVLLPLLVSNAASAAEITVLLSTPASITLSASCKSGEVCDQGAGNQAQAHCAKAGRNAELVPGRKVRTEHSPFSDVYEFRFNCVR